MAKRILVLNSYTLTERPADEQLRIRSFFEGLQEGGYARGQNVEAEIVDTNSLAELERLTSEACRQAPDLIHAVGTPNAIVAAQHGNGAPVVYYGAHPEGAGEAACRDAGVVGMVLTLPFTYDYKHFRFVRTLFPAVRRVWVPFYQETVFCSAVMRGKHERHRAENGSPWIAGDSPLIGYRSLAGLCYIIGVEYRELVYRDLDDLRAGLHCVEREGSLIMPYNDSVYCEGAPLTMTSVAVDRGIPLLWNNNVEATHIGAVAGVAGCLREAGQAVGRMAASILDGAKPSDLLLLRSTRTSTSLNLKRAEALGLKIPPEVIARFDEVL